jgi:hypothetical protein
MRDPIRDADRRLRRYWLEDGVAEAMIGALFVVIGLALGAMSATSGAARSLLTPVVIALVVGGLLVARRLIAAAKQRMTYPRSGFVVFGRGAGWRGSPRRMGMLLVIVAILVLSAAFPGALVLFEGVGMAAVLLLGAPWRARYAVVGAVADGLGVGLWRWGLPSERANALLYGLTGLALLLSGGVAAARYLRRNPLPAADAEPDGDCPGSDGDGPVPDGDVRESDGDVRESDGDGPAPGGDTAAPADRATGARG